MQVQDSPRQSTRYYPDHLGLRVPADSRSWAFLVEASDEKGETSLQIMTSLMNRGARILSQDGHINQRTGELFLQLVCDLRDSYFTPDDLLIHLRRMRSVKSAIGVSLKNKMFAGLLFPIAIMETERAVAIDSSLTFHIREKLATDHAKSGIVETAETYGRHIVETIKQKLEQRVGADTPSVSMETIQENVKRYLRASGWGRFDWQSEDKTDRVLIHDPPTISRGASGEGNYFLRGMIAGMLEAIWNKKYSFAEEHFDQQERLLTLVYASPVEVVQKEKVLQEIEKIIDSIEAKADARSEPPQIVASQVTALVPVSNSGLTLLTLMRSGDGFGSERERSVEKSEPREVPVRIEEHVGPENAPPSAVQGEPANDRMVGPYSVLKPVPGKEQSMGIPADPAKNHRGSARRRVRKPVSKYPREKGKKFAELDESAGL